MGSRTLALVATAAVLALVAAFILAPSIVAKGKYNEAKRKYEQELPGPFAVKEMDTTMQERLREIEAEWSCRSNEVGGPTGQAMKMAGMAPTVANTAKLFNYRMPPYRWFDPARNVKSTSIAAIQATIVPISTDQTIHISADRSLALILHSDTVASVFLETENGLQEAMWVKKGIEQNAAADADKARR